MNNGLERRSLTADSASDNRMRLFVMERKRVEYF